MGCLALRLTEGYRRGKSPSLRAIAKELNSSETRLRYLLEAADAPPLDRISARLEGLSTRELVRRSKQAKSKVKAKEKEMLEAKQKTDAIEASKKICDWLKTFAKKAYGETIIDEARRHLEEARLNRQIPQNVKRPNLPLSEIIEKCRPTPCKDIADEAWLAAWLGHWTFIAFPDARVRDMALNLALDKQITG
jgi:hypothetical protein